MAARARLTAVVNIGGIGKNATTHVDVYSRNTVTNAGVDWNAGTLAGLAQAFYDGWGGTPNPRRNFTPEITLQRAEAFSYTLAANPDAGQPDEPDFVIVRDLGPYGSAGPPVPGTDAGTNLPPQVSIVVSLYTPLLSRRGRGRGYLFPPGEPRVDGGGYLAAVFANQLESDYAAWVTGALNAASPPTEYLHIVQSLMNPDHDDINEVTSYVVRTRVDTQRMRLARPDPS